MIDYARTKIKLEKLISDERFKHISLAYILLKKLEMFEKSEDRYILVKHNYIQCSCIYYTHVQRFRRNTADWFNFGKQRYMW